MNIQPIPISTFRQNAKHYLDLASAAPIFIGRPGEVFKLVKVGGIVYDDTPQEVIEALNKTRPLSKKAAADMEADVVMVKRATAPDTVTSPIPQPFLDRELDQAKKIMEREPEYDNELNFGT
jgi:hypothetical protein